ncbi:MAG: hypothetical protein VW035_10190, partial [Luminiphilus sp.]
AVKGERAFGSSSFEDCRAWLILPSTVVDAVHQVNADGDYPVLQSPKPEARSPKPEAPGFEAEAPSLNA